MEAALSKILLRTHEVWERDMVYWTDPKRISAALALALMLCLQYFGQISLIEFEFTVLCDTTIKW